MENLSNTRNKLCGIVRALENDYKKDLVNEFVETYMIDYKDMDTNYEILSRFGDIMNKWNGRKTYFSLR
jgi:hypothetical protein